MVQSLTSTPYDNRFRPVRPVEHKLIRTPEQWHDSCARPPRLRHLDAQQRQLHSAPVLLHRFDAVLHVVLHVAGRQRHLSREEAKVPRRLPCGVWKSNGFDVVADHLGGFHVRSCKNYHVCVCVCVFMFRYLFFFCLFCLFCNWVCEPDKKTALKIYINTTLKVTVHEHIIKKCFQHIFSIIFLSTIFYPPHTVDIPDPKRKK